MGRPTTKLQDLERAAIRLFAARGLRSVTIKDIAKEAGCTEGALYRHYKSKEDMAWKLFLRSIHEFSLQLKEAFLGKITDAEKINKAVEIAYNQFDTDSEMFAFILLSRHNFGKHRKIEKEMDPREIINQFVIEGNKQKTLNISNPELMASLLFGAVLDPCLLVVLGKLKGPMQTYTQEVSSTCLKILNLESN